MTRACVRAITGALTFTNSRTPGASGGEVWARSCKSAQKIKPRSITENTIGFIFRVPLRMACDKAPVAKKRKRNSSQCGRHFAPTCPPWQAMQRQCTSPPRRTPDAAFCERRVGKPRHIVSPGVIEVIIQEDGWKQAELEGRTRSDLPAASD